MASLAHIEMKPNFNLSAAVHRHGLSTPNALAVACQGRSLTYGELAEQAARIGNCLASHMTGPTHDGRPPRVGIMASRSVDACVAMLGACWSGATYVPLGLKLPEERLLNLLEQCGFSAIVTDDAGALLLSERVLSRCPALVIHAGTKPIEARSGHVQIIDMASLDRVTPSAPAPMAESDTAYIIFTSGTTGVPKGVMISVAAARHFVSTMVETFSLTSSDRALETCELSFDISVHNMFSTWEVGASLHILPAAKVMGAVKFARESRLTLWTSVPSLAGMLRQIKALAPASLPDLRLTIFGGEPVPESIVKAWQVAAPNGAIATLYGPTETTVFCTSQPVTTPVPLSPGRDVIAIGVPFANHEIMVIDEHDQPLPDGSPGELAISGVQLAQGYLGAPELTAARFPTINGQRWYRSGDLGMRDACGRFHCLGRIDNQVKVMGHRVELEEIDAHLREVSGHALASAVAWPINDGLAGGIVSFVGAARVDEAGVVAALRLRLPAYMLPSRVIALADMPINANGKVDRRALRGWLEAQAA